MYDRLWIVMELLTGGSVLELMKPGPIPEELVFIIVRESLQGLAYLHEHGIVHRDIKGANILLASNGSFLN